MMAKAVEKLQIPSQQAEASSGLEVLLLEDSEFEDGKRKSRHSTDTPRSSVKHSISIHIPSYTPDVRNGVWYLPPST